MIEAKTIPKTTDAKLIRVEHQQKFNDIAKAKTEADTIAKFIYRLAEKEKMSCKALVCVSEHDIRNAVPEIKKTGQRGRPIRCFLNKFKVFQKASKVKPHLHILIKSDEANKVAQAVVSNINTRYRKRNPFSFKKVVSRRYPVTDKDKYVSYVMHQGTAKRFVDLDYKKILKDFDYEQIYETYKPNLF